ncbi:hypothetical protein FACS189419_08490 [Planctomycetales bacterium]|nr:hypothetical protein FACS189419_08490 [Planctomycetales bacterium]
MFRSISPVLAVLFLFCVLIYPQDTYSNDTDVAGKTPGGNVQWKVISDSQFALTSGGKTVWQFNADPKDAGEPYFHPLCVAGSPPLTMPKPADHPWHLAHWFSWKYINGVNYWETDKSGKSAGETYWDISKKELRPDGSAAVTLNIGYRPRGTQNEPVLTEKREIDISAPDSDGTYSLDWTQTFTAQSEVKLDRTPITGEPNGVSWGGYAGLGVRFSNALKEVKTVYAGTPTIKKTGKEGTDSFCYVYHSPAMEQNGILDGKEYGIAIFPDPKMPRSGDWYYIDAKDFIYFSPVFLLQGHYTMQKGETLPLRYRVVVHKSRWNAAELEKITKTIHW